MAEYVFAFRSVRPRKVRGIVGEQHWNLFLLDPIAEIQGTASTFNRRIKAIGT